MELDFPYRYYLDSLRLEETSFLLVVVRHVEEEETQ
jgi:hypothetical protein